MSVTKMSAVLRYGMFSSYDNASVFNTDNPSIAFDNVPLPSGDQLATADSCWRTDRGKDQRSQRLPSRIFVRLCRLHCGGQSSSTELDVWPLLSWTRVKVTACHRVVCACWRLLRAHHQLLQLADSSRHCCGGHTGQGQGRGWAEAREGIGSRCWRKRNRHCPAAPARCAGTVCDTNVVMLITLPPSQTIIGGFIRSIQIDYISVFHYKLDWRNFAKQYKRFV